MYAPKAREHVATLDSLKCIRGLIDQRTDQPGRWQRDEEKNRDQHHRSRDPRLGNALEALVGTDNHHVEHPRSNESAEERSETDRDSDGEDENEEGGLLLPRLEEWHGDCDWRYSRALSSRCVAWSFAAHESGCDRRQPRQSLGRT